MDLLTRTDLEQLTRASHGVHVSVFVPTHRSGEEIQGDPLRLRNVLDDVEGALLGHGTRRPDVDGLLAPGRRLQDDIGAWQRMSDGLALFLGPEDARAYRLAVPLPTLATIGDRFVLGPVLPMLTDDEHFLLLALSRHEVRLFEGSRHRIDELDLADVPTSLRDLVPDQRGRSEYMARRLGDGGAVFYGHGGGDGSDRKEEVRGFFREVAGGVAEILRGRDLPMVLAGLSEAVAMYRGVNAYGHVLDAAVEGSPEGRSPAELHAAAWPVIADRARTRSRAALDRVAGLLGTGRATTDPSSVEAAAGEGRVETLLLPSDDPCWSSGPARVVELGDGSFADCELRDRAAVAALAAGGAVHLVPATELPDGVAAVLRY